MVSTDNENRRRARALALADRYPASRQILEFYAALIGFDSDWPTLRARLLEIAPEPIQRAAALQQQPEGIFLRILCRHNPTKAQSPEKNECPNCGSLPQCGALREEGQGHSLFLVCSVCTHEWNFPRSECPACLMTDEKLLGFYTAEQFPHVQTLLCETCRSYLHIIHCGVDPQSIPDVDELACTPLDIWAMEQGYTKLVPNLAGL